MEKNLYEFTKNKSRMILIMINGLNILDNHIIFPIKSPNRNLGIGIYSMEKVSPLFHKNIGLAMNKQMP